jgi:hypothetical protein
VRHKTQCPVCSEIVDIKSTTSISGIGMVCELCLHCEYVVLRHSCKWGDRTAYIAHKFVGLRKALANKGDSDLIGVFKYLDA